MRLRTVFAVLFTTVFLLGLALDGWSQERKKRRRSKAPQVLEGAVYEVGKRTIQLDTGKRRRGRVSAVIIPVDSDQTKFLKVSTEKLSLTDLKKGDVVIIKYNKKGKYDPVPYVISTGERREIKEGRRGKKKKKRE
jgi:hypothetical protein